MVKILTAFSQKSKTESKNDAKWLIREIFDAQIEKNEELIDLLEVKLKFLESKKFNYNLGRGLGGGGTILGGVLFGAAIIFPPTAILAGTASVITGIGTVINVSSTIKKNEIFEEEKTGIIRRINTWNKEYQVNKKRMNKIALIIMKILQKIDQFLDSQPVLPNEELAYGSSEKSGLAENAKLICPLLAEAAASIASKIDFKNFLESLKTFFKFVDDAVPAVPAVSALSKTMLVLCLSLVVIDIGILAYDICKTPEVIKETKRIIDELKDNNENNVEVRDILIEGIEKFLPKNLEEFVLQMRDPFQD